MPKLHSEEVTLELADWLQTLSTVKDGNLYTFTSMHSKICAILKHYALAHT